MSDRSSIASRAILFVLALSACQPVATDTPADGPGSDAALAVGALASLSGDRIVDLTHPFEESMIVWPTGDPFRFDTINVGETEAGYFYSAFKFAAPEHGGTHLDAPYHFAREAWAADEIPLDRLIGPGVVIDVSAQAAEDPDYQFTVDDVTSWEADHGRIPEGAIVLFFTDRGRLWPDAEAYMGTAERGAEAVADLHFPGIHPDLARWLVANRSVSAVGLDTPSIDHGQSADFETHRVLYGANIPGFENVTNLGRLPATGAAVIALPMKIAGGSGGPLRIVAVLP